MGIYSDKAKQAYLEADLLYGKKSEDYFKSRMFYGYAQVLIDAKSDSEAAYLQARAINDFDTFKKCYTPAKGDILNGIVLKQPLGEANEFVACTTTINGDKKLETVKICNGKVVGSFTSLIETTIADNNDQNNNTQSNTVSDNKPTPSASNDTSNSSLDVKKPVQNQNTMNNKELNSEPDDVPIKNESNLAIDF